MVVERILSLAVSVSRSPWKGGVPGVSSGSWWRAGGSSEVAGVPKRSFWSAVFRALENKFVQGASGGLLRLWNKGVVGDLCAAGRVGVPKTES